MKRVLELVTRVPPSSSMATLFAAQFRGVQGGEELFRTAFRQMDRFDQKTELTISTERFCFFRERHLSTQFSAFGKNQPLSAANSGCVSTAMMASLVESSSNRVP